MAIYEGHDEYRICINCQHWYFLTGEPGYSEVTPGCEASTGCDKGHWTLRPYHDSQKQYRSHLLSAISCKDFEPIYQKD